VTGDISADGSAGGVVGTVTRGTLEDSYANVTVTSPGNYIGGVVGFVNVGTVQRTYATGAVSGLNSGGVSGFISVSGTVQNSYWDKGTTDQGSVIAIDNGGTTSGLTGYGSTSDATPAPEIQGSSASSNMGNLDFTSTWETVENDDAGTTGDGYPILQSIDRQAQLEAQDAYAYAGGDGSTDNPYEIANWYHLNNTRENLDAEFILTAGLDSNTAGYDDVASSSANGGNGFDPIGDDSSRFTGTFNGTGHTISNLSIDRGGAFDVGLFGFVDGGPIEKVGLENADITGKERVGGLVGKNFGTVSNSYATGTVYGDKEVGGLVGFNFGNTTASYATSDVSGTGNDLGGLVGSNVGNTSGSYATGNVSGTGMKNVGGLAGISEGEITESYATGNVSGNNLVGGLVGVNTGTVTESYATGNVSGTGDVVGGLVARNFGATVTKSYATGSVTGTKGVGGLVGVNSGISSAEVSESYAAGSVTGTDDVGGLVGVNNRTVSDSYWDTARTNQSDGVGRDAGGTATNMVGLTTPEMTGDRAAGNMEPFDFSSTWQNTSDDDSVEGYGVFYPTLQNNTQQPTPSSTLYAGGFGSSGSPYQIETWFHLDNVRQNLGSEFVLTADLDSNTEGYDDVANSTANGGNGFDPIGDSSTPFTGTFNGTGHAISNLSIDRGSTDEVGMFGFVDGGPIEKVGLENVDIAGEMFVGGLVGFAEGPVRDSYVTGSSDITGADDYVGGLVGNNGGTVTASYVTESVDVTGVTYVGGLVGNNDGSVSDSYAAGSVSGDREMGGLVGRNLGGTVTTSYATGDVDGTSTVGGLVGNNGGTVSDSYATGNVSGTDDVGGLVGFNFIGDVTASNATGTVDGDSNVGGLVGINNGGTLTESYATSSVDGTDDVGGLVGQITSSGARVSESYATGDIDGSSKVGGLVGFNNGGDYSDPTITESYATGAVTVDDGSSTVGGLVGENDRATVTDSYWDIGTTNQSDAIGSGSGSSLTGFDSETDDTPAPEMVGINATVRMDKLDFSSTWRPGDGDDKYPDLAWNSTFTGTADAYDALVAGDGSSGTPYEIEHVYDLQRADTHLDDYFEVQTDIDASETSSWNGGKGFDPIGSYTSTFTGTFDGAGHTISDLFIDRESTSDIGLFGEMEGTVESVGLENADITGNDQVGGLVGYGGGGTVTGVSVTGSVDGTDRVGGLVGFSEGGTVEKSAATVAVTGSLNVGGLVGRLSATTVSDSYATGDVTASDDRAGGLVGGKDLSGEVTESYATGNVSGTDNVGGLVGINEDGPVTESYATGNVSGSSYVGGLVGQRKGGAVSDSYWDTGSTGQTASAGSPDSNGLTTTQMQRFGPLSTMDGFSFDSPETWLVTSGYPALAWESVTELTVDTVEASDQTVAENKSGTINVTAKEGGVNAGEGVTIEVLDNDSLDGFATGDTTVTDANGNATFSFDEPDDGSYEPEFAWADDTSVSATSTVTVQNAPEVSSIERASGESNPTNAGSVEFEVTFTESVSGVDAGDFSVVDNAGGGAGVGTVTEEDSNGDGDDIWLVELTGLTGDGDVSLDLNDDDSITNDNGVPLGGVGTSASADGTYTGGESFTVDNTAPALSNDFGGTDEDTAGTVVADLLSNDSDANTPLTITKVNGSSGNIGSATAGDNGGQFTIDGNGEVEFDPNGEFESLSGGDSTTTEVSVTVADSVGNTDTQTVEVTVDGVNDAPSITIGNDQTTNADTTEQMVTDFATGFDPGGGESQTISDFTVTNDDNTLFDTQPDIDNDGDLTHTPANGINGTATVSVQVVDDGGTANGGEDTSSTKTFDITVDTRAPAFSSGSNPSVAENTTSVIDVNADDGSGTDTDVTYSLVSGVDQSAFSLDASTGSLSFASAPDYENPADSDTSNDYVIDVQAADSVGNTNTQTIIVDVTDVDESPTASDDSSQTTDEDSTVSVTDGDAADLLELASDPDAGDTVSVDSINTSSFSDGTAVMLDSGATVTVNDDGSWAYDPNGQYDSLGGGDSTTDAFSYTVADSNGDTAQGTITVTVTGLNDAPTAISLTSTDVAQSGGTDAVVGTLSATDADDSSHKFSLVSGSGDGDNTAFNINNGQLRADDAGALAEGDYDVRLEADDGSDGYETAVIISVTDDIAPTIASSTPADDATGVAETTDITITFSEDVALGTESVTLREDDDGFSDRETFDVSTDTGSGDGTVSVSGSELTITPTSDLASDTEYAIRIDAGALTDTASSSNDFAGISDDTTLSFTTTDSTPPTAKVGTDTTIDEGESVSFDGTDSTDNVGIVSYDWNFDDGDTASGATTTHAFDSPGTYDVALTVTDAANNEATAVRTVTVESDSDGSSRGDGSDGSGGGDDGSSDGNSGPADTGSDQQSTDDSDDGTGLVVTGTRSDGGTVSFDVADPDGVGSITLDFPGMATDDSQSAAGSDGSDDGDGTPADAVVVDRLSVTPTGSGSREFGLSVRTWPADALESRIATDDTGTDAVAPTTQGRANDSVGTSTDSRAFLGTTGSVPVGYVEVTHTNPDTDIENVTFRFRIQKVYLDERDVAPSTVALYRNETDGWSHLPTEDVGSNGSYYLFESVSPGLSLFAIGSSGPTFVIERASGPADTLTISEPVTVDATVRNLGRAAGAYTAELRSNGTVVAAREVELAPNSTRTVSLSFTPADPGEYTLTVGTVVAGTVSVQSDEVLNASTPAPTEQANPQQTPGTTGESTQPAGDNGDTESATDASGPGFGVAVAFGVLLTVVIVLARRQS
jgi:methionine-rich copper-binding protein CopC